jgi:hypothetical protein
VGLHLQCRNYSGASTTKPIRQPTQNLAACVAAAATGFVKATVKLLGCVALLSTAGAVVGDVVVGGRLMEPANLEEIEAFEARNALTAWIHAKISNTRTENTPEGEYGPVTLAAALLSSCFASGNHVPGQLATSGQQAVVV